ncbi:NAD(+) diphosphatase [Stakelama sp. CBK3Z-3]|uniref:NAD(+) diphosphatase n=1 Tax=Stakelama flava TaxID=2860338 RepID=A0ABS6XIZ4_9SPHN|nr:NAD(+) diphosphatase [Stakelama flava]
MIAPGLTGGQLDRADPVRTDPEAIAAALRDPHARLLRLDGLAPVTDAAGGLQWRPLSDAGEEEALVLLGFDGDVPHFVAVPPRSVPGGGMADVAQRIATLPREDAAHYAAARSLVAWHMRHRFCSVCGGATDMIRAGWARKCTACAAEHFPRTDPVVIMIAEHDGRALLGRQAAWPQGRWSALAGFLEVGESIEEAVVRETHEEAGIHVGAVRYVASQPWPFPSSLMIACIAEAKDDAITVDTNELEDARWFTREQVAAALAGGADAAFLPPPRHAIAHTLLSVWLERQGER